MELLGIVGFKNSGKTTLITRLIPALRGLGLSVSTIKHVHHAIDLDEPGKDTFAHREAGAVDVVMFSDSRWALLHERRSDAGAPPDFTDLMRRLSPVDLVLVEGFKSLPLPKIEIRSAADPRPVSSLDGDRPLAVVVDTPIRIDDDVPLFGRDDIAAIAGFIAGRVRRATP